MRFALLLADADWIKVVIPLVMFSVYALNKLFGGDAKKAQPRPRPVAPPQPQGERQRVEDEVAEFLRRATQGKEPRSAPPPTPPKPPRKSQGEPREVRRLAPKRDEAAPLYDDDVADTRRPTVTTKAGEKRSLGRKPTDAPRPTDVDQADEAMESHIHQALDHQVGSLAGTAPSATSDQVPAAEEGRPRSIASLLRSQQSVRDAIIVSEILRRPTERW